MGTGTSTARSGFMAQAGPKYRRLHRLDGRLFVPSTVL